MSPANPFLTRELRRLSHRPLPLQAVCTLVPFLMFCAVGLLWLAAGRWLVARGFTPWMLGWVASPHVIACFLAGLFGGDRLLAEEHRRGAWAGVALLPLAPGRRVWLQLAFPLYLLKLVLFLGLPLYVLLEAMGKIQARDAAVTLAAAGLSGGLGLLVPLLLPPDGLARLREVRTGVRRMDMDLLLPTFTIWLGFLGLILLIATGALARLDRPVPWFGISAPVGMLFCGGAGTLTLAALLNVLAEGTHDPARQTRASAARTFAALTNYYAVTGWFLGLRWNAAPLWTILAVLLAPAVLAVGGAILLRKPREDLRAIAEIAWASGRSDNPLFLRDIRVYTRHGAALPSALRLGTLLLLGGGVHVFLALRGGAALATVLDGLAHTALVATACLAVVAASRAYTVWTQDRRTETLTLLFVTPLGSEEILQGRIQAAVAYSVASGAPIWLCGLLGALWFGGQTSPYFLLGVVTLIPVLWLFLIALGCVVRPQRDPPWKWPVEDWLEAGLGLLQLVSFAGSTLLLARAAARDSGLLDLLLAGAVLALNLYMAWACFRLRVRTLNRLREGDLQVN